MKRRICWCLIINLVPRNLRLFGQRLVVRKDTLGNKKKTPFRAFTRDAWVDVSINFELNGLLSVGV